MATIRRLEHVGEVFLIFPDDHRLLLLKQGPHNEDAVQPWNGEGRGRRLKGDYQAKSPSCLNDDLCWELGEVSFLCLLIRVRFMRDSTNATQRPRKTL